MATWYDGIMRGYHFWREIEKPQSTVLAGSTWRMRWTSDGLQVTGYRQLVTRHGLDRDRGQSLFSIREECGCGCICDSTTVAFRAFLLAACLFLLHSRPAHINPSILLCAKHDQSVRKCRFMNYSCKSIDVSRCRRFEKLL